MTAGSWRRISAFDLSSSASANSQGIHTGSSAAFLRDQAGYDRREYSVARARHADDGAVEQIFGAGSDHGQQIGDGGRLLHSLRRHGRRAGGHRRSRQDARVRSLPLAESRRGSDSKGHFGETAFGRVAPRSKGHGFVAAYDVLDPILEAYVERYEPPEQIAAEYGFDLELVQHVVRLVERSEYKRQQAAPVLKVTSKSFGMGRRFPIAVKSRCKLEGGASPAKLHQGSSPKPPTLQSIHHSGGRICARMTV